MADVLDLFYEFYQLIYTFITGVVGNPSASYLVDFADLGSMCIMMVLFFALFTVPFIIVLKLLNFVCGGYAK